MTHVELSTVEDDDTPMLVLRGEFDVGNIGLIEDILVLWSGQNRTDAVMDMSGVTFIDSATVNLLAQASRRGLRLSLHAPSRTGRRALELCGMGELLPDE